MAAFDDIVGKAQAFLKDEKVQDKLHGAKTEEVSDRILNAAEDAVNKVTGNRFSTQLAGAKDKADRAIGAKEPAEHPEAAKVVGDHPASTTAAADPAGAPAAADHPTEAKAPGKPAGGSNLVGDLARGTKAPGGK